MNKHFVLVAMLSLTPGLLSAAPASIESLAQEIAQYSNIQITPRGEQLGLGSYTLSAISESGTFYSYPVTIAKIQVQRGMANGGVMAIEFGRTGILPTTSVTGSSFGITTTYPIWRDAHKPALTARLGYSAFVTPSPIALNTLSADLTISKKVSLITPYAGMGLMYLDAQNLAGSPDYSSGQVHYYLGAHVNLRVLELALELGGLGATHTLGFNLVYHI